jgi:hypothetical protein
MYCLKLYLLCLIIIVLRATGKINLLLLTVLPSWNKVITYFASKNIFRVYHIMNNCTPKKWFTRHETDRFPNNHCQECVRAYLSIHDWFFFVARRVQILVHAHIICITVREHRIICCQIFCNLLLKSAFERTFNVMQLILVKINSHIKWKYLIQK